MRVRVKVLIVVILSAVLLFIGLYLSSQIFFVGNIRAQEVNDVNYSIERTIKLINREEVYLDSICRDWATWDDTYNFMKDNNKGYIDRNFDEITFNNLRINFMLFVDNEGKVKYAKAYDYNKNRESNIASDLLSSIILQHKDNKDIKYGLYWVDGVPMMISAHGITTSDSRGEKQGSLIMGKNIDSGLLNDISDLVGAEVKLYDGREKSPLSASKKNAYDVALGSGIKVKIDNENSVIGYTQIQDINGQPAFNLELIKSRFIYREGIGRANRFMIIFSVIIAVVLGLVILINEKMFLKRLERLSSFVSKIAVTDNSEIVSSLEEKDTKDEITSLKNSIRSMLYAIDSSKKEVIRNEQRLQLVIEASNNGYWDLNMRTREIYISPHLAAMIDYTGDLHTRLENLEPIITKETLMSLHKAYDYNKDPFFKTEQKIVLSSGKIKWFLIKGKVAERKDDGRELRIVGMVCDVTERKESEEAIKYLSYHDALTGLYNRTYLNQRLAYLNKKSVLPLSIVMVDANGLKITNDAFGHKAGDKLLMQISGILRKACRDSDTIARLGGDEFIILLPDANGEEAEMICQQIKSLCESTENYIIKPSVALGSATKYNADEDIEKTIDRAEERMYTNKLLETKSARHSIVASLERSLLETDYETREHAKRMQDLSMKMGKELNLTNSQLDELSLLAALHDIGKIAIPTEILMKPSALNKQEWEIIKSHTEIGYRIAISSIELGSIASPILYHHERWDGSGYPNGLKGEDIPLFARIIAIIDAYDVITHSRPYKAALSRDEAIEEIKRCSGSHFDPKLVSIFLSMMDRISEEDTNMVEAL